LHRVLVVVKEIGATGIKSERTVNMRGKTGFQ
jgi:hypothetical protein